MSLENRTITGLSDDAVVFSFPKTCILGLHVPSIGATRGA